MKLIYHRAVSPPSALVTDTTRSLLSEWSIQRSPTSQTNRKNGKSVSVRQKRKRLPASSIARKKKNFNSCVSGNGRKVVTINRIPCISLENTSSRGRSSIYHKKLSTNQPYLKNSRNFSFTYLFFIDLCRYSSPLRSFSHFRF